MELYDFFLPYEEIDVLEGYLRELEDECGDLRNIQEENDKGRLVEMVVGYKNRRNSD